MQTQWEYKVLKLPMDFRRFSGTDFDPSQIAEQLNKLGAVGWELVSAVGIQQARGDTGLVCAVMKRARTPDNV